MQLEGHVDAGAGPLLIAVDDGVGHRFAHRGDHPVALVRRKIEPFDKLLGEPVYGVEELAAAADTQLDGAHPVAVGGSPGFLFLHTP